MASTPRTTHSIGPTNLAHPVITFSVNLTRARNESIGPNTNSREVNVLHPDLHDNSPERGRANAAQHDLNKITWLPGLLAGENIVQIDDGTFTAYGQKALYLKNTYTTGPNPLLEIISGTGSLA